MDANRLAALLNGSLSGAEQAEVIAEVASLDDGDLDVFADAAVLLREQEEGTMGDDGLESEKRAVPPSVIARRARADALRPHVSRWVEARGLAAVASRAEMGREALRRFVNRGVTPQPGTIDAFEEMMQDEEWAAISRPTPPIDEEE